MTPPKGQNLSKIIILMKKKVH